MALARRLSLIAISMVFAGKALAADKIPLDLAVSKVMWTGKKPTGSHSGIIPIKEGYLEIEQGQIVSGELIFDMTRITTTDQMSPSWKEKLNNHLRSDDFFAVKKFPVATYKIERIQGSGAVVKSIGSLKIKDITKPVEAALSVKNEGHTLSVNADVTIDRTKWKLMHMSKSSLDPKKALDSFIYDDVIINAQLVTTRSR